MSKSVQKLTNNPPVDIKIFIVSVNRVFRSISITNMQPPTFLKWAGAIKAYPNNLPGKIRHVVFDEDSPWYEKVFKKSRPEYVLKRNISD